MVVSVLYLFLAVHLVGLQCVIVTFPVHTHLLIVLFRDFKMITSFSRTNFHSVLFY